MAELFRARFPDRDPSKSGDWVQGLVPADARINQAIGQSVSRMYEGFAPLDSGLAGQKRFTQFWLFGRLARILRTSLC
ncbi:MAG: hypothetical protein QNJ16_07425 [Rhodobacter sp.]|nr:hypothetical protein [Rhodobacter sp.]